MKFKANTQYVCWVDKNGLHGEELGMQQQLNTTTGGQQTRAMFENKTPHWGEGRPSFLWKGRGRVSLSSKNPSKTRKRRRSR